jgi:hypothetical protein
MKGGKCGGQCGEVASTMYRRMVCWHALAGKEAPERRKEGPEGGVWWTVVVETIGRHRVRGLCLRLPSVESRGSVEKFTALHGLPVNARANSTKTALKKHTWMVIFKTWFV